MAAGDPLSADGRGAGAQDDLRRQVAELLRDRIDVITTDAVAIFPHSGVDSLDTAYCRQVSQRLALLLAAAIRDGRVDARGNLVADLHRVVVDRALSTDRLVTFMYLTERSTVDELALDDRFGAASEPWPLVAQLVRRASFDLLAAYIERAQLEPGGAAITDSLTTLHTRALFDAVLAKEVERAARFGDPISLILFDVDHLSAINQEHGYGVGDKVLERIGILVRNYFRQHDWAARHSDDSFAVLLSRTDRSHASELAERVRNTVEERLGFVDHRTDRPVTVTVSAAIINVSVSVGDVLDTERLMIDAERALERAKRQGRNRVERVDGYSGADPSRAAT